MKTKSELHAALVAVSNKQIATRVIHALEHFTSYAGSHIGWVAVFDAEDALIPGVLQSLVAEDPRLLLRLRNFGADCIKALRTVFILGPLPHMVRRHQDPLPVCPCCGQKVTGKAQQLLKLRKP
jgi:hypothetical protein